MTTEKKNRGLGAHYNDAIQIKTIDSLEFKVGSIESEIIFPRIKATSEEKTAVKDNITQEEIEANYEATANHTGCKFTRANIWRDDGKVKTLWTSEDGWPEGKEDIITEHYSQSYMYYPDPNLLK